MPEAGEPSTPMFSERILEFLESPGSGRFVAENDSLVCRATGKRFDYVNGVPSVFVPSEGEGKGVTERVKSFYEDNPFPNYEGMEDFGELVNKGSQNPFSAELLKAIGYNKTILECGCGTGQLSHFLQLNNNHVLGIDMSLSSLGLAIEHKLRNELPRSSFAQMNIFNLAIKDNSFDVVISHGVLHHTYDARLAFSHIVKKLKPGGIVMVGLYNSYARVPTYLRSKVIGLLGPKIDYVVRNRIQDARKAEIWIRDQYYNPHETWHSLDEVLSWFDEDGIEFLNASPAILGSDGEIAKSLFAPTSPGTAYQRVVTQLSWLYSIAREGALFDVIGKKKE
jgi:2-polyprenyl-3-methyl-5-hydroxy-6-metoxy-1,4-benzoquinol methylase